jgi:hypothetical protein
MGRDGGRVAVMPDATGHHMYNVSDDLETWTDHAFRGVTGDCPRHKRERVIPRSEESNFRPGSSKKR